MRVKEGIDLPHKENVGNYASEPVVPEIGLQTGNNIPERTVLGGLT
jgi:hypothetical protein